MKKICVFDTIYLMNKFLAAEEFNIADICSATSSSKYVQLQKNLVTTYDHFRKPLTNSAQQKKIFIPKKKIYFFSTAFKIILNSQYTI